VKNRDPPIPVKLLTVALIMNVKLPSILFCAITCSIILAAQAPAQEQRREFIQGLLKTLIESQLENSRGQPYPQGRLPDGYPQVQPIPAQPRIGAPTAKLVKVRRQFADMSRHCDKMIVEIRTHEAHAPQLRGLLADCLQIKASINVLVEQSKRCNNVEPLMPSYAALDRDWRSVNHRLSQIRGLDSGCRKCINQFHGYADQVCTTLDLQPQFNRMELAHLTAALATSVEHLIQDIHYDLQGDKHQKKIIRRAQAVYSQIVQAAPLVQRGSYDQLARAYKGGMRDWRKLSHSLRDHQTPRICQDVQKIEDIGAQISDVMWFESEMDREYLCDVLHTCDSHVDRMLNRMTVAELLNCKSPGAVLASAREFKRHCGLFSESLTSGKSMDDLLWDYRSFGNHWNELNGHLSVVETKFVVDCCTNVGGSMEILDQTFGAGPIINRATLLRMGRDLDQLTNELSMGIHQNIVQRQYPGLHQNICGCCDRLHQQAHQLHEHIISSRGNQYDIQRFAEPLYREWVALKPLINQCKPQHRQQFGALRSQIEPLMVKLQVAYTH
jgi:hypothetical protein